MKVFKIKRGPRKNSICHIKKDSLRPYQINYIESNKLVKKHLLKDDRFAQILLRLIEYETRYKDHLKLYYNDYTGEVSTFEQIVEDANTFDWKCCICKCFIKSRISNFEIENFVCKTCKPAYIGGKTVDERIMDASVKFRKFCQHVLLIQQKCHIIYLQSFASGTKIEKKKAKDMYQYHNNQSI